MKWICRQGASAILVFVETVPEEKRNSTLNFETNLANRNLIPIFCDHNNLKDNPKIGFIVRRNRVVGHDHSHKPQST